MSCILVLALLPAATSAGKAKQKKWSAPGVHFWVLSYDVFPFMLLPVAAAGLLPGLPEHLRPLTPFPDTTGS